MEVITSDLQKFQFCSQNFISIHRIFNLFRKLFNLICKNSNLIRKIFNLIRLHIICCRKPSRVISSEFPLFLGRIKSFDSQQMWMLDSNSELSANTFDTYNLFSTIQFAAHIMRCMN